MTLRHRLQRFFAPNSLHRQLHPPPALAISFRPYCESDRTTVLDLHDQNAPARFPEGHRPKFEKFIDSPDKTLLVVESDQAGVVACCGITAIGDNVHVLCYGLVAREFQGMRIGATMTLARLCFATRNEGMHCSLIYAVPKSMGYYRRFGYAQTQMWQGEDGKQYPAGALAYNSRLLKPIADALRKRGHLIDPSLPLKRDQTQNVIIKVRGSYDLRLEVLEPNPPVEPSPHARNGSS